MSGAVVVAVGLAAGCGGDGERTEAAPVVQLGGPGETGRVLTPDEASGLTVVGAHTAADVAFVTGMIHHHRQALEMTALVDERAGVPDLALLAERIEVGQTQEIALLEGWLTDRGEELPSHGEHGTDHGELMPGMLTADELRALAGLAGEPFDVALLSAMIRHHEGAIVMVEALLAEGGGQEPTVFQLASGLGTDQAVEIARMKSLLADIAPPATAVSTAPAG